MTVTSQNGTTINTARNTDLKNAITSRSTIYDQREGKNVDVATLDISKVVAALNAGGISGFNNTLYINDTTPLTTGNTEPKTVRLANGGVLPSNGLTVVSENPVYVQGDYNTGTTTSSTAVPANNGGNPSNTDSPTVSGYTRKPAAVIADAVMLLSNNWNDSNANKSLTSRTATHTTFNMAIMAGFMPSGYQPVVGARYGYSGGAINYPRFLEDWTDESCTYFGSMVELFESKTFTGEWDTGVIYRPPNRRFNFDTNFTTTPPPGSLNASSWSRGTWPNTKPPMKRPLCTLLLAALLPQLAPAAVDLTPRFIDLFLEGTTVRRLYFADGDKKFTVSTNRETEVTPDAGGALFRFKKVPDATFLLIRSRHSPQDKFEGLPLERYRESAKRLLPVKSRGSVILEETPDTFPINDWKSYRILLAFDVGAVRQMQSVTFINLNDSDQVVLVTSAPESDFQEAAHRSYQIFRTWQEVLPGDEAPVRTN